MSGATPFAAGVAEWLAAARDELAAAESLVRTGGPPRGIYQHSGVSVEYALKALIIHERGLTELPREMYMAKYHRISVLYDELGGLRTRLQADLRASRSLNKNWLTVRNYDPLGRFPNVRVTAGSAGDLFRAVNHHDHGVIRWLLGYCPTI